jgi:MscS family membrane protein
MSKTLKKIVFLVTAFAACLPLSAPSALSQILPSPVAVSTTKTSTDWLNRETPSGCVFGFLEAAQSGNYSTAAQYLQLTPSRRQTDGENLAQQLKVVMDRALSGSLKNVSTQPEGTPQEGMPSVRQNLGTMASGDAEAELVLVRVSDPAVGKIWLISAETLNRVPELYDQVEARQVERKLPAWLVKHALAGMPLWQWFALLLTIPVAAGVAWVVLVLLQFPLQVWARRQGHEEIARMHSVSGAAWLLLGTLIDRILAAYLGMPLLQRHYYSEATTIAVIAGANWILWRVIRWFMHRVRMRALARGRGGAGSLMLLGERLVKAAIFVMTLFFVMSVLGFNLTTALAGVGIGTLAIGFGAQQTIANLFGGVSVLGDEVIRVGDLCKFGDRTGVVEDIGLRSTRVRTEERTLLAIPNGTVATINVENLSRRDKLLFKTVLALHAETSQQQVSTVVSEIRSILTEFPKIESTTSRVRLSELTASAINVELFCYVMTKNFDEFAAVREAVLLRIMNLVEDSGANLASSTQKFYLSPDPAGLQHDDSGTEDAKRGTPPIVAKNDRQNG